MSDYVWYACYGSNMLFSRFKEYIDRCDDNALPVESREFLFPYPVYFGSRSQRWGNHGTAFLNSSKQGRALGRIYKIKKDQFDQIKHFEVRKYSYLLDFDFIDGVPVFSFTSQDELEQFAPSLEYYDTILLGMMETFSYLDEASLGYSLACTILPGKEFNILEVIRKAEHGVSAVQVSEQCAVELGVAVEKIEQLIALGFLRKDRRTLQFANHDPDARFYTIPSMRNLIDRLIGYRHSSRNNDIFRVIRNTQIAIDSTVGGASTDEGSVNEVRSDQEGRRVLYYTTRYERSPRNREEAIRIHGTKCQVCGFDFSETYGEIGRGFIEVHHVVPLHSKDEVVQIDPANDLICICANCHRMIHRAPQGVFTVDELKALLQQH